MLLTSVAIINGNFAFTLYINMRLQYEMEVLSTVIKDKTYGMEGEFLIETSIEIVFQDRESKIICLGKAG
jgi:hypothetical protein